MGTPDGYAPAPIYSRRTTTKVSAVVCLENVAKTNQNTQFSGSFFAQNYYASLVFTVKSYTRVQYKHEKETVNTSGYTVIQRCNHVW